MAKRLKGQAPIAHVWCKDGWRPVGVCAGRCKKAKKCVIYKTYQEVQERGKSSKFTETKVRKIRSKKKRSK